MENVFKLKSSRILDNGPSVAFRWFKLNLAFHLTVVGTGSSLGDVTRLREFDFDPVIRVQSSACDVRYLL